MLLEILFSVKIWLLKILICIHVLDKNTYGQLVDLNDLLENKFILSRNCSNNGKSWFVALTLHGFTSHDPHFTQGLCFCQMESHYVVHYTISSLYTVKKHYLSIKGSVFHFTRISLYTIYSEKQKSCRVRATCNKKFLFLIRFWWKFVRL